MTVYGTIPAFTSDDNDAHYEDFRDRCDRGEQCPDCRSRFSISVAIDMRGDVWFHCDTCKHEWPDEWSKR
jgi:hypothetical protein